MPVSFAETGKGDHIRQYLSFLNYEYWDVHISVLENKSEYDGAP
jgi:hypothetical protein